MNCLIQTLQHWISRALYRISRADKQPLVTGLFLALFSITFYPVVEAAPLGAATGNEWTTPLGTLQGTRYSNLAQITSSNANHLVEERVIKTETKGGHEGQPLVVNVGGKMRMFVVTPWPNRLMALDMTGKTLWTYTPNSSEYAQGQACCDVVNRGASYAAGKVVYSRLDGVVIAVNASTGTLVWQTRIGSLKTGETLTGAPIIAGSKVIVGNAGGEMGVRGWVQALDLTTGKPVWKAYNTGPDAEVKINAANNFYAKDKGPDLGSSTWPGTAWKQGGSTTWAWFTYDPDLKLVFYGTANPGVWNPDMRPGPNKWSASIFARNPDTGVAKWANQLTPHDGWDYDAMNESIVVTTPVPSGKNKALVHFNKNGFAYMLDAWTGQVVQATPFVHITWASGFNVAQGAPDVIPEMAAHEGVTTNNICPSPLGGKEFAPASYSPQTGMFYVPGINFCSNLHPIKANYIAGTPYMGADTQFSPDWLDPAAGTMRPFGELIAWKPDGSIAWTVPETVPLFSGTLATAGNVVFYGTLDRKFHVVDATTGAPLWTKDLECGVMGNPITYMGDDGKQRVAVYTGIGWLPGGFVGGPCPGENDANKGYESGAVHIFKLM
ncbi:methanol dehydrogenase [Novimethylophilus kurashikiensis]|uniref:Methanol dehydrogenase n=1 Tax=Novimethylophilus kurashikiensis TaxID=1825523 RepID=A0A2R5FHP4_9PROT|nr:PQQ-dependent dehydrogenase, methanol/ethanol family [Novimethylophilus kurashikiensis]GBG15843.1 methanol dehydrogenase [Novimethylophilus kurashikiensis]